MLLLSTEVVQVWHAYLAILITGACWALDTPSRRAVIYDLLGAEGVGRVFLGGSLLALVGLCVFSMSRWYILSLPALLFLGLGTAGFGAMQSTLVMLAAREEMRGRALGVLSLAIGTGPFGSLLMGATASAVHPVFAMRMHALLGLVSLACIMVLMPAFADRTQPVRVSPIPRQARS